MKKSARLDKDMPEIGKIVRAMMKEQRITHRKLGQKLGWHSTTVTAILQRRIWTIAELLEVGRVLNTDLLKYYYPAPPEAMVPASELKTTREQLQQCRAELESLQKEAEKLRTENDLMKQIVLNRKEA